MVEKHIIQHLNKDIKLRPLLKEIAFPAILPSEVPLAIDLIKAIVYQQLSTKAATTIYTRLIDLFPDQQIDLGQMLSLSVADLRAVGVSRQKATYIHNISDFFQHPDHRDRNWSNLTNEDLLKQLTSIKGVGVWTVKMIMMSNLGRADVFASGDLGIQTAMTRLYNLQSEKKALQLEMNEIARPWSPYRTYACYYLWRWRDSQ